jgi:hypothetical protein
MHVIDTYRWALRHWDFAGCMPLLLDHIKESLPDVAEEAGAGRVPAGDFLPQWLLDEYNLMPWLEVLPIVHPGFVSNHSEVARQNARRRLAFNECLLLSLMMLHHRVQMLLSDHSEKPPVICNNQVTVCLWLCRVLVRIFLCVCVLAGGLCCCLCMFAADSATSPESTFASSY